MGRTRRRRAGLATPHEVRADFTGISVCMHVSGLSVTRGVADRRAARRLGRRRTRAGLRGAGEPVCQHLRSRLSEHGGRAAVVRAT